MAEWSIASDLKSDEPKQFREFKSHSFLINYSSVTSITEPLSVVWFFD
jgi:hypothetical protein